jgi:hypothetical protein
MLKKYKLKGWYNFNWGGFGVGVYFQTFNTPKIGRCSLSFDVGFLSFGVVLVREVQDFEKLW